MGTTTRVLGFLVATTATTFAQPVTGDPAPTDGAPAAPIADPAPEAAPPPVPAPVVALPPAPSPTAPDVHREQIAALNPSSGFKDGFIVAAGDNSSRLYIGAISQFDGRFFVNSPSSDVDQFVFNTLRIDLRGTIYDHYDFRFLPDFANGKLVVQDAYVDIHYADEFKIRVGKTKVPFGLERLQNETSTTFVQRGLPTDLAPNRDLGIEVFGNVGDGVLEYQVGLFNGVADNGIGDGDATDDKEGAARIFIRPFAHGPALAKNFGFGGAATYGDKGANLTQTDTPTWKDQGQTTFFSYVAPTGGTLANTVVADGLHWRATGQGYYYAGPFGFLTEYVRSVQHVVLNGTHDRVPADSFQFVGQWVLTGEDATYNSVTPLHPFDPKKGTWGAFDIAARVGEIRLVDTEVFNNGFADPTKSSRRAWSTGAGVDWFANKAFRAILDVERTWFTLGAINDTNRPTETSIVARAQLAF